MDDERRIKLREPCKQHKKCTFSQEEKKSQTKLLLKLLSHLKKKKVFEGNES